MTGTAPPSPRPDNPGAGRDHNSATIECDGAVADGPAVDGPAVEGVAGRNLILTGFMGTGKTTVGRIVAERLDREFVDTDRIIEERHGPIPKIFARDGEAAFRSIERALAGELAGTGPRVVSTGGGMLLDDENSSAFAATGLIICLTASPERILDRVLADSEGIDRPLLSGPDPEQRIMTLLTDRAERYGRFDQVPTDGRSPDSVADAVIELFMGQ